MEIAAKFKGAYNAGAPIVSITTPDPAALVQAIQTVVPSEAPVITWDVAFGLVGRNDQGRDFVDQLLNDGDGEPTDLVYALTKILDLAQKGILFVFNAHEQIQDAAVRQAIWNLRDRFKQNGRSCVLVSPHIEIPASLVHDVVHFDDPLPNDEHLTQILTSYYGDQRRIYPELPELADETPARIVEAGRGLSPFGFEQVLAMGLRKTGIDLEVVWEQKQAIIRQTPGLEVYDTSLDFGSVGGLAGIKQFMNGLFGGNRRPTALIWIDEIEKAMAGAAGDNTGVSQDILGVILTEMNDNKWAGLLPVGPPGSGKSLIAQSAGKTFNVPTFRLDLGGLKQKEVGASEANIRAAMRVIKGVAGNGAFFIGTCNSIDVLPTELLRRYKFGLWFFDLPTPEERQSIWQICLRRYGLPPHQDTPDDTDWTGAEIDNCCDIADRMGCSITSASQWIRPVAVYRKALIERMRQEANGNWNAAAYAGPYRLRRFDDGSPGGRRTTLED